MHPQSEVLSLVINEAMLVVSGNIDDVGWGDGDNFEFEEEF